jgi:hypothetical protein
MTVTTHYTIKQFNDDYINITVYVDVENYQDIYVTNISFWKCRVEIEEDKDVFIKSHENLVMMYLPLSRCTIIDQREDKP